MMTALRRLTILTALAACLLVITAGLAMAGEQDTTSTTILGEGPTEITLPITDPNVLGPEAGELPDTGAGSALFLIAVGAVLITAGVTSTAFAVRPSRR